MVGDQAVRAESYERCQPVLLDELVEDLNALLAKMGWIVHGVSFRLPAGSHPVQSAAEQQLQYNGDRNPAARMPAIIEVIPVVIVDVKVFP